MTTTVPVNTPSGSDGAVNVSVVVELLARPHQSGLATLLDLPVIY